MACRLQKINHENCELAVAVGFDFDFLQFPCVGAVCAVQKMDQEEPLSEPKASFGSSHFLYCTNGNPAGATTPGSPFLWILYFGEAKESISAAGPRPGLYPRRVITLIKLQYATNAAGFLPTQE